MYRCSPFWIKIFTDSFFNLSVLTGHAVAEMIIEDIGVHHLPMLIVDGPVIRGPDLSALVSVYSFWFINYFSVRYFNCNTCNTYSIFNLIWQADIRLLGLNNEYWTVMESLPSTKLKLVDHQLKNWYIYL